MSADSRRRRGLAAPLALPAAFAALLVVGAAAAGSHGAVSGGWVIARAAAMVASGAAVGEPAAVAVLGVIGWLTVCGFSGAPYARLQVTNWPAGRAAIVVAACSLAGLVTGVVVRRVLSSFTLWIVDVSGEPRVKATRRRPGRLADLTGGIGGRRVRAGTLLLRGLPLLTLAISATSLRLDLGDDLLIYLVAVVAVAVVGGFWPAVLAAITASLLVNWYFTPPVHTLTIADGKSLLAPLLFVTVAGTVSSVVHPAAFRAAHAARR